MVLPQVRHDDCDRPRGIGFRRGGCEARCHQSKRLRDTFSYSTSPRQVVSSRRDWTAKLRKLPVNRAKDQYLSRGVSVLIIDAN
jgi:hypothetical protein